MHVNFENRRLEDMTWENVRVHLSQGTDKVIAGVGSVEQHGPHLPLLTDSLIAETLCSMIVQRRPDFIVGPTLRMGHSPNHMDFPGTISLQRDTLRNLLIDYASSLLYHGLHVYFIITHGGNFGPVEDAIAHFLAKGESRVRVCLDRKSFISLMHRLASEESIPVEVAGAHAGELETSIMRSVHDYLVRKEKIDTGFLGDYDGIKASMKSPSTQNFSSNGIIGDARFSDPDRGARYLEKIVTEVLKVLETH